MSHLPVCLLHEGCDGVGSPPGCITCMTHNSLSESQMPTASEQKHLLLGLLWLAGIYHKPVKQRLPDLAQHLHNEQDMSIETYVRAAAGELPHRTRCRPACRHERSGFLGKQVATNTVMTTVRPQPCGTRRLTCRLCVLLSTGRVHKCGPCGCSSSLHGPLLLSSSSLCSVELLLRLSLLHSFHLQV